MESEAIKKAGIHIDSDRRDTVSRHLISHNSSLLTALGQLNRLSGETLTLFVVDEEGRLRGSLTDGDIRRALLGGATLDSHADSVCKNGCLTIDAVERNHDAIKMAREKQIALLPVIKNEFIIDLIDLRKKKGYLPLEGVLMAGGAGERLRPLTLSTPKPLLEVGRRPIIDYNIELMEAYGIDNIYVTVNYLKQQIIDHVSNLNDAGAANIKITCIEEPTRLGTIGSVALIPDLKADNIVVMNSDLLTDINLEEMFGRHRETEADVTVAVVPYTVSVPYAIMKHKGERVEGILEKPTYNYFANAGIYMLRKSVIDNIPPGSFMDAPDLIEKLIKEGRRVSQFPIRGRWIDIGSPDDYRHACDIMS